MKEINMVMVNKLKLSILIPTLESRKDKLNILLEELERQCKDSIYIEVLIGRNDGSMSIGHYRNQLLETANGEYVVFLDDDDWISPNYISHIIEGIDGGSDCITFRGEMTWGGVNPQLFDISIKYKEWKTRKLGGKITYERYPNHITAIKSSIAKRYRFPDKDFSEDYDWSKQIKDSKLLNTEHHTDDILYYYRYMK